MRKESQFSIFYPNSSRDLAMDYPELYENENFRKLNRAEKLFVWYWGCRASPFWDLEDVDERLDKCIHHSFGSTLDHVAKQRFMSGNFSEKIDKAIIFMNKFQLSPRVRASKLTEKILKNIEKLIDVEISEDSEEFKNKDGEADWSKKKAYIDSCEKATKILPDLIRQVEEGYGVTSVMIKKTKDGEVDYTQNFYEQE